jgi:Bacterial Ig domain
MRILNVTLLLACMCCTPQAFGFRVYFPTDHSKITTQGLWDYSYIPKSQSDQIPKSGGNERCVPCGLNFSKDCGSCDFGFMDTRNISNHNMSVDGIELDGAKKNEGWPEDGSYHCDNDSITECSRVIREHKRRIVNKLSDIIANPSKNTVYDDIFFKTEIKKLGYALHTIQDFYSHSNWVEMQLYDTSMIVLNNALTSTPSTQYPIRINEELYTGKGPYLPELLENGHPCLTGPKYHEKVERYTQLNLRQLTSGYYYKNPDIYKADKYCNVLSLSDDKQKCLFSTDPEKRVRLGSSSPPVSSTYNGPHFNLANSTEGCIHGGAFNEESYIGIAKDHPNKLHHDQAFKFAKAATTHFVETIISDVKEISGDGVYTDWAVLSFLGHEINTPHPEPPTNVKIIHSDKGNKISFTSSQSVKEYQIIRTGSNGTKNSYSTKEIPLTDIITGVSVQYIDEETEPDVSYCYRIRAFNDIRLSEDSEKQCQTVKRIEQTVSTSYHSTGITGTTNYRSLWENNRRTKFVRVVRYDTGRKFISVKGFDSLEGHRIIIDDHVVQNLHWTITGQSKFTGKQVSHKAPWSYNLRAVQYEMLTRVKNSLNSDDDPNIRTGFAWLISWAAPDQNGYYSGLTDGGWLDHPPTEMKYPNEYRNIFYDFALINEDYELVVDGLVRMWSCFGSDIGSCPWRPEDTKMDVTWNASFLITYFYVDNTPPVAKDDIEIVSGEMNLYPIENDYDQDGYSVIETLIIENEPLNGSLTNQGSYFRYRPAPGFSGIDTFTYSVKDNYGLQSNIATFTLDVGVGN